MLKNVLVIAAAVGFTVGCSEGGTGPAVDNDGRRIAAQFDRLADSVDAGGYSPAAEALRHAAEIVRLTGHASPVRLTIDGATRGFLAVAEQIDFPNLECSWPSDSGGVEPGDTGVVGPPVDSTGVIPPNGGGGGIIPPDSSVMPPPPEEPPPPPECRMAGTYSMRTLIAWEPEHMAEVVRVVADVGSNSVATGVPDVMTALPSSVASPGSPPTTPPDSSPSGGGGGSGGYPGFMGEYLVRDVGSWWAVEGNQSNALVDAAGACTDDRATFDWAEFSCEAASFRLEFEMRVEPLRYEPLTGVVDRSHTLSLGSSSVDGVRLEVVAWTPPPLPPEPGPGPDPLPVDPLSPE